MESIYRAKAPPGGQQANEASRQTMKIRPRNTSPSIAAAARQHQHQHQQRYHQHQETAAAAARAAPMQDNRDTWDTSTHSQCSTTTARWRVKMNQSITNIGRSDESSADERKPPAIASVSRPTPGKEQPGAQTTTGIPQSIPERTQSHPPYPTEVYTNKEAAPAVRGRRRIIERSISGFSLDGESLAQEMNENISTLRRQVIAEKRLLFRKEGDIDKLEFEIQDIETDFVQLLQQAHDSAVKVNEEEEGVAPANRRDRIDQLRSQIADLQDELMDEVSALKMEESQVQHQRTKREDLARIDKVREERDSILVLRQVSQEEAAAIARSVTNLEAELKSLCTIARMALNDEF